ncbi:helix-turn-helix domain-containing protein [Bacillus sp. FSL R12-0069]|uniref:helix-turn-helix domain-containing protein n=1 Tax=Bacillus sp. FSL R12-0069 TaxID=2975342 RepID=UPI0030F63334
MEGHSATSTSHILGICRQSVSTYVHIFNSDGIDGLLERRYPPGRAQYLSSVEKDKVRHMLTSSTPAEEGIGLASFKLCWKNVTIFLCLEVGYVICYTAEVYLY